MKMKTIACFFTLGLLTAAVHAGDAEFFESKIRPVLVQSCYKCHSATTKSPKGGLRLDSRAALLAGGESGPSIVPGMPSGGTFLEALRYKNADLMMPPAGKLPDAAIADFETWIKRGAVWPDDVATATGAAAIPPSTSRPARPSTGAGSRSVSLPCRWLRPSRRTTSIASCSPNSKA